MTDERRKTDQPTGGDKATTGDSLEAMSAPSQSTPQWAVTTEFVGGIVVRYVLTGCAIVAMLYLAFSFHRSAMTTIDRVTTTSPFLNHLIGKADESSDEAGAQGVDQPASEANGGVARGEGTGTEDGESGQSGGEANEEGSGEKGLDTEDSSSHDIDILLAHMAVALEYESMAIRTKVIQTIYGMMVGLVLCVIGVAVLSAGIRGSIALAGKSQGMEVSATTAAPGALLAIAGAILIGLSISRDLDRQLLVEVMRDIGARVAAENRTPPGLRSTSPDRNQETEDQEDDKQQDVVD